MTPDVVELLSYQRSPDALLRAIDAWTPSRALVRLICAHLDIENNPDVALARRMDQRRWRYVSPVFAAPMLNPDVGLARCMNKDRFS